MDKLPWFPFYGRDFFGDEKVKLFTARQIGFYLYLLWHEWEHGSIPSKDECLKFPLIGRAAYENWCSTLAEHPFGSTDVNDELTQVHSLCFVKDKSLKDRFYNTRLEEVRQEQLEEYDKKHIHAVKAGRASALARAQHKSSMGSIDVPTQSEHGSTIQTQTQNQTQNQTQKKNQKKNKSVTHAMPESWSLSEKMREYGVRKGMTPLTIDQEFEHCKSHHEKTGSTFTEKGWASSVWTTWVLNWIKFGSTQAEPPRQAVPQAKCAYSNTPCEDYALPGSKYCATHKAMITRQQEKMKAPGAMANLVQDVKQLVDTLVQGKAMPSVRETS